MKLLTTLREYIYHKESCLEFSLQQVVAIEMEKSVLVAFQGQNDIYTISYRCIDNYYFVI